MDYGGPDGILLDAGRDFYQHKEMCHSESCLLTGLLGVILFFAAFLVALLKMRKVILKNDLQISAPSLLRGLRESFPELPPDQVDVWVTIWQDRTATESVLVIKNERDEAIGQVEFALASRRRTLRMDEQSYEVKVHVTWGGTLLTLHSADGKELARLERSTYHPMKHRILIVGLGELRSQQSALAPFTPIRYERASRSVAWTRSISPWRRVGRVGVFSSEVSRPVRAFILAMSS